MKCPRCLSSDTYVCKEGREDKRLVWTMYYCRICNFNWRDSEPEATLNPELRPSVFQLDQTRFDDFEVVLPPRKR
jgi:hypothetical protein